MSLLYYTIAFTIVFAVLAWEWKRLEKASAPSSKPIEKPNPELESELQQAKKENEYLRRKLREVDQPPPDWTYVRELQARAQFRAIEREAQAAHKNPQPAQAVDPDSGLAYNPENFTWASPVPEHLRQAKRDPSAGLSIVRPHKRVSPQKQVLPMETLKKAAELRDTGLNYKAVAKHLGVSYGVLLRRLDEHGMLKRGQK